MLNLVVKLLTSVSTLSAYSDSSCVHLFFDEPECPRSLIEK